MATIKLNSSGAIITKGGLPSCTCCGIKVLLGFFVYGSEYSDSFEIVNMTGSTTSGVFTGTCSKGGFSLRWDEGEEDWLITFDEPVPTTGDGDVTGFHGTMRAGGGTERFDPEGYYVQTDSLPFPNWTALVPV